MINIPPLKQSTSIKTELIADITKVWKVGQILNATAEKGGQALSNVQIRVGQYTLEAKTPIALRDGQDVKLMVKALPDKTRGSLPLLSILTPDRQPTSTTPLLATNRLRQFISVQQSFSQIQLMAKLLLENKLSATKLSASLNDQFNTLQSSLTLSSKNISGTQLQQLILNSGIFFESKLLKQNLPSALTGDFKYQLLSIRAELRLLNNSPGSTQNTGRNLAPAQLKDLQAAFEILYTKPAQAADATAQISNIIKQLSRPAITQLINLSGTSPAEATKLSTNLSQNLPLNSNEVIALLSKVLLSTTQQYSLARHVLLEQLKFQLLLTDFTQQLDQSISKLTSLQLQPLSRDADNMLLLLFNLIFKENNENIDVNFRIQQQDKNTDESSENWLVTLSFNFKVSGKIQSKIHLTDNHLSSVFHTELSTTADKIQQLLPMLQSALEKAGFDVAHLAVKNKLMDEKPVSNTQAHLLDENI